MTLTPTGLQLVDPPFERFLLVAGDVELLVEVARDGGPDDEVADDGEEAGEAERGADEKHDDAEEGDDGVEEGQVAVDVWN